MATKSTRWIKMRSDLWGDPRICWLCDVTGAGEAAVIGALYWLWSTADQYASTDGLLRDLTLAGIDRKSGVRDIGQALESIGWIEVRDEGVLIMHFDDHCSTAAKKRAETARRVAKHKTNAVCVSDSLAVRYPIVSSALPERVSSVSGLVETGLAALMLSQLDDA